MSLTLSTISKLVGNKVKLLDGYCMVDSVEENKNELGEAVVHINKGAATLKIGTWYKYNAWGGGRGVPHLFLYQSKTLTEWHEIAKIDPSF
jgi:hypothetical protein